MNETGISFTLLKDEWCCGSPLLRTGQWNVAIKQAKHNVEIVTGTGAKSVVTSCAGCYRTWKKDYPELGINYDFNVIHITELLEEEVNKGKLKFSKEFKEKTTYHDPCHIGRHMGIYDAPRAVLKAVPRMEFIEMKKNKEMSLCCGAGGGVKSAFPDLAVNLARERLIEALQTGAEAVATACPFCLMNFQNAIREYELRVKLYDVVEVVAKAL